MCKKVYILNRVYRQRIEYLGVFSSFELTKSSGNTFLSRFSQKGPFIWEKAEIGDFWTCRTSGIELMVFRAKLDFTWWTINGKNN
jgi:hypothetical protein